MENPSFIFSSDNLELKSENGNFFVEGYISTSDIDLVNDIVTKACLLDMAEQMKSRVIKFDVEHESFRGKSKLDMEVNKTIIPVAKVDDFLMDKKGLRVRAMLNPHSSRFHEVKGSIEGGFLDAFSIAYVPVKTAIQEKGGMNVRLLDKINLLNVAFTGNPVNTEARMTSVFAKSLEFLKEQEKACGPGGHKPDKTGPHGRGEGPGQGRADGSGKEEDEEDEKKKKKESKNHSQSNDIIKLQEAKKMSEENEKVDETQEESAETENSESQESNPAEAKDEEQSESNEEAAEEASEENQSEGENAEVKSLRSELDSVKKELAEVKSLLKKPLRKSKVEQQDKSKNFADTKSQNPLDLIA